MKGPSLDAIRKFKQQQEIKKREEEERKIKEKLSTLEHRALQGDRKAKQDLKRIEKVKSDSQKQPEPQKASSGRQHIPPKAQHVAPKPKKPAVTDFDELMKLAKNNNNELRKEPALSPPTTSTNRLTKVDNGHTREQNVRTKEQHERNKGSLQRVQNKDTVRSLRPPEIKLKKPEAINLKPQQIKQAKPIQTERFVSPANRKMKSYETPRYIPDNRIAHIDEDEYEDDDFVVDDDEEDAQDALRQTLRSVFRYDKRRCDLREQELDREYRAIGRVSTFEDLEREERRASRLAAIEDAKAQREEEERKRAKKLRLKRG